MTDETKVTPAEARDWVEDLSERDKRNEEMEHEGFEAARGAICEALCEKNVSVEAAKAALLSIVVDWVVFENASHEDVDRALSNITETLRDFAHKRWDKRWEAPGPDVLH
jgi:hypothetical protein